MKTKRLVLLTVSFVFAALLVSPVLAAALWDTWAGFQKPVKAATIPAKTRADDLLLGNKSANDFRACTDYVANSQIRHESVSDIGKSSDAQNTMGQGSQTITLHPGDVGEAMWISTARWITPSHLHLLLRAYFPSLTPFGAVTDQQGQVESALANADEASAQELKDRLSTSPIHPSANGNIDISVGGGGNTTGYELIQVNGQISSVPEASTMLAACALLTPAILVFRRRSI